MRFLVLLSAALISGLGLMYLAEPGADNLSAPPPRFIATMADDPSTTRAPTTTRVPATQDARGVFKLEPMPRVLPEAEDFLYEYSDEYLASLDDRTKTMALQQVATDAKDIAFAPMLELEGDTGRDGQGRILPFTLKRLLAATKLATVFTIKEYPKLVVKYQVQCRDLRGIHPVVLDFVFLQALAETGIVPRALFVSPPVKFSNSTTEKTDFGMSRRSREICAMHPKSSVRFLVMERIAYTLFDLVNRKRPGLPPFDRAISIGLHLLTGLETMHRNGVIHGDIHLGNVGLLERDGELRISFIDFGYAEFVRDGDARPALIRLPWSVAHHLLSVYELEGFRRSYRDDVYRAVQIIAILLNGPEYYQFLQSLDEDIGRMALYKNQDFIFANIVAGIDPIAALDTSETVKNQITRSLTRILFLARNMHRIASSGRF